ncbi:sialate O-acetylesterase [Wenyingzhuangia aestuarii]|uniref:sialate O-acetylesterase n=1 Tax=Wenyingzhuangia aestuarii TaxID=1647582 RepID=UPI00143967AA|nr:sialate O-acetylesterase [Wenyingzhuangia aestuarii]NJB83526.1 sialate O-acetylesterase [Wenyingzhuangia aestuarii]
MSTRAQTKIASIFGNHMVLQRNSNVQIWGTDIPNTDISLEGSWGQKEQVKTDKKGHWKTTLKTTNAGGPYVLTVNGSDKIILKDILLGEVWICTGQSNMAMPLKGGPGQELENSNNLILNSSNANLRFFTVSREVSSTPLNSCKGNWEVSSPKTAANFSAVGYSFGKRLQEYLHVPIGLISSNVGGTPAQAWTPKETIVKEFPEYKKDFTKKQNTKSATVLYNGMIHPLIPFTIKGAIWYQGEGNRWDPEQYARLFPAMIKSWRQNWKQGVFPFYFVQLAPFGNKLKGWVGVQQAQLKTMLTLPNTGMAVINDMGYKTRIHPPKKKEVGERLALWALAKDYKVEGIQYSGPIYKSIKIVGSKALIDFEEAPLGITSMGKTLKDFEIAGEDGIYYQAKAKIINKGTVLQVWNDEIKKPKNVRYGWQSYIEGSLFNTAGLPASSFSTEGWSQIFKK